MYGRNDHRTTSTSISPPPAHHQQHQQSQHNRSGQQQHYSPSSAASASPDADQVRWAWSVESGHRSGKHNSSASHNMSNTSSSRQQNQQQFNEVNASPMRDDMLDVVKLLSTSTSQCQTEEPSFVRSLYTVKMEGDKARSIATQAGTKGAQSHTATQVNESEVADVEDILDLEERTQLYGGPNREGEPLLNPHLLQMQGASASLHSHYAPHSNVPADDYPVFLSDARALGICNRYGFVSMPRQPVELPPRRRVKTVQPIDYPHLYGSHDLSLDEGTKNRINRTHNLWVASSGFVPKY